MKLNKLNKRIRESKVNLFILLALICSLIVFLLDLFDTNFSYHDILVESHGLIFDLFIFGILLTFYETVNNKREKIERYTEEINDYKFWESEEAMFRTRGLIKRLVDLNAKNLDLSHCYLANDKSLSSYKNMSNWRFSGADLSNSLFLLSTLENAHFYYSNLMDTRFDQVNLTNCKFSSANLYNTDFEKCILYGADFSNSIIKSKNWFYELEKNKNIGVDEIKNKFLIIENPESIDNIKTYIINSTLTD